MQIIWLAGGKLWGSFVLRLDYPPADDAHRRMRTSAICPVTPTNLHAVSLILQVHKQLVRKGLAIGKIKS